MKISSKHTYSQTVRARDQKFLDIVHHPLCFMCHMSHLLCYMSHVTRHVSHAMCHMSCVRGHMSLFNQSQAVIARDQTFGFNDPHSLCVMFYASWVTCHISCVTFHVSCKKKSRIWETKHLLTNADNINDTTVGWTKNTQKPEIFEILKKSFKPKKFKNVWKICQN